MSSCKNCDTNYINKYNRWCKACQIDKLKRNFTNGNEKIDV